jgi:hypothetical protein
MKIQIIIAITFVAIIGMMIPNTFAQQLSISISGNPNPIEYQGNSFTVNFEGELLDYGKVYWSLYEKNSSQKSNMLEALSTDTKSWTKNISFEFFPFVGETYIFEIKNGHIIEQFEFTVQKESYVPLEDLNVEDIFVEETIPIQTEKEIVKFDFMVDYQCSSIDKFDLVIDPNDSEKSVFEPTDKAKISVTFPRSDIWIPDNFKVLAYYSDDSVEEFFTDSKGVVNIPQKNYDGILMKYVLYGDGFNPSENKSYCNYDNVDQEYLEKQYVKAEQIEQDNVESQDYCNYLIDGCKPIYNVNYEINAPNDFIYKSWMEYNNIKEIKNISYDFHKINKNSFSYLESTHKKNGVSETANVNEKFEFTSMFIPSKSPITETDEDLKVKRTNMNFAGVNRDVVYIEFSTSDKTLLGFVDINEKWYYDWNTGLLLKQEFQRSVLDVSGKTNSDKFVKEISTINFPKEKSSKGGGCLIATATYGSEMATEVQQLRELRDNTLMNARSGVQFMGMFNDVYYSFSPIIADYERENPIFKEMVKVAITPLISSLSILNYVDMNSESEVLGYGISLIILNLGMYLGVPAVVIVGIRKIR